MGYMKHEVGSPCFTPLIRAVVRPPPCYVVDAYLISPV